MAVNGVERSTGNNIDGAERSRKAREEREAKEEEQQRRAENSEERSQNARQEGVGEQVNTQA